IAMTAAADSVLRKCFMMVVLPRVVESSSLFPSHLLPSFTATGNPLAQPNAAPGGLPALDPQLVLVLVLACGLSRAADLPDHPRAWDLDERTVTFSLELRIRVRLAEVPHRAVVDDVGAMVGPELDIRWPVEAIDPVHERLLGRLVESKP